MLRRQPGYHASGVFDTIAEDTGSSDTTFEDTTVSEDTRYVYRVAAINSVGTGPVSSFLRVYTENTVDLGDITYQNRVEFLAGELVVVDPRFTSQRCSRSGAVSAANREGKRYNCTKCGMAEDADVNADRNILDSAMAGRRWQESRLPAAS